MEIYKRWITMVLLVTGGLFLGMSSSYGQPPCTGGTMAGSISPALAWQTIPCIKGGEYYEFNAVAGTAYTFTFCMCGGDALWDTQITILDGSGNYAGGYADDECILASHLWNWVPGVSGVYRVLINEWNGFTPCQIGTSCASMAYKYELVPGSAGTNCSNPWVIPSLPYQQGGLTTCGFVNDYTSVTSACSSTYMDADDFIFTYNGTAGECISIFTRCSFLYTGIFVTDDCPNAGGANCLASVEAGGGNPQIITLTLPTTRTYYIAITGGLSSGFACTPFDIEVVNCVAVGQGNTCSNAFVIPSVPYTQYGFTTCGKGNDYDSTDACGNPYILGDDFVFKYTSPGNECVSVELSNTVSWAGFQVMYGCPGVSGSTCVAGRGESGGNPKLRTVNLTAAGDYYIVVSTWPFPDCTPFELTVNPCAATCSRNPNLSNSCSSPTVVSLGMQDTICGYSNYLYTPDVTADLNNDFCGSIENNGWFSFTADSTTMTIQFDVDNCLTGFGIQGRVFSTSNCISFTPVSNCWNPQIEANGRIQAVGLTVGNTYYLMIDGYAGDDCEFIAYRVGGPLPVAWGPFSALPTKNEVNLNWETLSETNNKGFNVQRGRRDQKSLIKNGDNMRWQTIKYVKGQGDDPNGHRYNFTDHVAFDGKSYFYRIQQEDFNGVSDFSDVIEVEIEGPKQSELIQAYPTPANIRFNLNYYAAQSGPATLSIVNLKGQVVKSLVFDNSTAGLYTEQVDVSDLASGIYYYVLNLKDRAIKGKMNVMH